MLGRLWIHWWTAAWLQFSARVLQKQIIKGIQMKEHLI